MKKRFYKYIHSERRNGLLVTMFGMGASGLGLSPGWGDRIVLSDKALHCHSASLQVYKWAPGNVQVLWRNHVMD